LQEQRDSDKLLTRRFEEEDGGREAERENTREGRAGIHSFGGRGRRIPERENREIGDGGDDATGVVCRT
jgi:hypothetical protein